MGDSTGISWTDATWNPIRGCSRISEGCRHCYAETIAARFSGPGQPYEGLATRKLKVIADDEQRGEARWTGEVRFVAEHLADPLRWKKPRRIFVNSMSDLFHEKLTSEQIAAVFGVMAACPRHTFQVLTKRAKRMRVWFEWAGRLTLDDLQSLAIDALGMRSRDYEKMKRGTTWPLPNVWLGVSVEHQDAADERIPELLRAPAVVRFLSCEPLIGPIILPIVHVFGSSPPPPRIDWIIAGCESGHAARPCDVDWIRSLRDQCATSNVAFFLKQAEESVDLGVDGLLQIGDDDSIAFGDGSKLKARGPGGCRIVERPYLDGVPHTAFPEAP